MTRCYWVLVGLAAILFGLPACEPRKEDESVSPLSDGRGEPEYYIAVVFDVSGSYVERVKGNSPKAYEFFLKLTSRYANDRGDSEDCILISQISQSETALLWEGTPRRLRRDFHSPEAFRDFLLSRSNPQGSRVYANIARTIERLLENPAVQSGRARSAVFVLSDMDDNASDGVSQKARLLDALRRYGKLKHAAVGLYWVSQNKTSAWKDTIRECGIKHFVVEPDQISDPALPTFD